MQNYIANSKYSYDWMPVRIKYRLKRGVVLTGRNTTGPPSRADPWWITLHMCHRGMLQMTTDDDRCQSASLVWLSYIMCRRTSNNSLVNLRNFSAYTVGDFIFHLNLSFKLKF